MNKISIGLLLPSSTIFPISKDFERGLNECIKQHASDLNLEISKAFIGQGSLKQTEDACNKFFTYDDVDLVTGIISGKVADEISEKFNKRKKPLIVNTLGEYIPDYSKAGDHVFFNSLNLWQHAWSIGHYGVKNFGKKGMFIGAVYDAGYSFSQMFHAGMQAADPESQWSFSVPPMPPNGSLSDMNVIFPFLEKYQPDFVFAAFCGAETSLFINEFIGRGWHKKTKLLGLPFLLSPFEPLIEDIIIYTTAPFSKAEAESCFHDLGYQTGQMIVQAARISDGTDLNLQLQKLQKNNSASNRIGIIENNIKAGEKQFSRKFIQEYPTLNLEEAGLKEQGSVFGWENPYLCI